MARASASAVLSDPAAYAEAVPHAELARLRQTCPVAWVDEVPLWRHARSGTRAVGGSGYWAVTSHEHVVEVSRQPEVYSSWERGAFLTDPKSREDLERTRQSLINMDAPQHTSPAPGDRQRVHACDGPRAPNTRIRCHAQAIADRIVSTSGFDVVMDVAAGAALLVVSDLLGMPAGIVTSCSSGATAWSGLDDPDYGGGSVERYERTYRDAFTRARAVAARRRQPSDDLISMLVQVEADGQPLSDAELCHLWLLLVVAGNESTRHFLSGSLLALCEWPDQRTRLAGDPQLIPTAVEELLRWVSPIMQFRRTVVRETELNGQRLGPGEKVVMYYVAANRDERVFSDPERLDLARRPNPHLAFGVGRHFCLGARLARTELGILLAVLGPAIARLERTGPVKRLVSNFMNGIKALPARFTPEGERTSGVARPQ